MRFKISHVTKYSYQSPASELFMDVRLSPPTDASQTVISRSLVVSPECPLIGYTDYFGNHVEQFSIISRHESLVLRAESEIETHPMAVPEEAMALSFSEARQVLRRDQLKSFDFLHSSPGVELGPAVNRIASRFFNSKAELGQIVHDLMAWVNSYFKYTPGSTHVGTTVDEALKLKKGVCQDYAHVMIAILRSGGIPARYVCGYIETDSQRRAAAKKNAPKRLIGAAESHAWVDLKLPNGDWYALDPTNNIPASERHVVLAVGRDFHDTSPTRGVFKGAGRTSLKATVQMLRLA
jgi:transglutaminase-like putative cysteine protease